MCGIAGKISFVKDMNIPLAEYSVVSDLLSPRGPDESGRYVRDNAILLHRRLSVVDITLGKQPMRAMRNGIEYALVYNGELYNTDEVRASLFECGHSFNGHSDTEVILHAYMEWGENCVSFFNGIFAFAIWEEGRDRLFIARDRIGVKPFFYSFINNDFFFASEIKALLAFPEIRHSINLDGIAELILIAPGRTPGTGVITDIEELPPAHKGYFTRDGLIINRYWELIDRENNDSFEVARDTVEELVRDSIERQLVSDVPLCTFLSGGLDSSIISSITSKYLASKGEKLHTFSVTYRDMNKHFVANKFQPNSDNDFIGIMTDYLGSEHHTVILDTPELVSALEEAVDARDLPGMADIDSSLLLFAREVKQHFKVALSGECADEIFGGYPWFRDPVIRERYGFPWAQTTDYRYSFLNDDIAYLISPHEYISSRYESTIAATSKINGLTRVDSRQREMTKLNMDWFMQTLLDRKDRMTMHNGLEVRVPFCDYRIAEYLYSLPWEYKDYLGVEKGLLREAMRDYLPEAIRTRKKSPYPKTHNPNYLAAVRTRLTDIIEDSSSPILQLIKKEKLQELLTTNTSTPWYGQLMTTPQTISYFIQLNYWLAKFQISIDI